MYRKGDLYYPEGNPGTDKEAVRYEYKDENGEIFYILYTKPQLEKFSIFSPYIPLANSESFGAGAKIWYSRPTTD
jgi:hypothetical protein